MPSGAPPTTTGAIPLAPDARPRSAPPLAPAAAPVPSVAPVQATGPQTTGQAPQSGGARHSASFWIYQGLLHIFAAFALATIIYAIPQNLPQNTPPIPERRAAEPTVLSQSDNTQDWPVIFDAARPDDKPNGWRFAFNAKLDDRRVMTFKALLFLDDNLRDGHFVVRASKFGDDDDEAASLTPALPVLRVYEKEEKIFLTTLITKAWKANPANTPSICLSLTSGAKADKFEPEHGGFCVASWQNGQCGAKIGCGRFE